jgi:hypothetical protein
MLSPHDQSCADEAGRLVREYFAGKEAPLCEKCGEELVFTSDYALGDRLCLKISCRGCGRKLNWQQSRSPGGWTVVHLNYFLERVAQDQVPRCPIDDSSVSFAEFEGGVIEFRCPFCNRRGRIRRSEESTRLHLNENESIVFLTV